MSTISLTKLYDLLSAGLGKANAENLTNFIDNKINQDLESKVQNLATKTDLAETKSELMKWMFIFWVGQLIATFGFMMIFIKR